MIDQTPQTLLFLVIGALVAGWLIVKIGALLGRQFGSGSRDCRDDRIRSLEAELRVARTRATKVEETLAARDKALTAATSTIDEYAKTMNDQLAEVERLRKDLRTSVRQTHKLREDLADRAEESLRSTVRLKQAETELSVVLETSDMLSTGRLSFDTTDADIRGAPNVVKLKKP